MFNSNNTPVGVVAVASGMVGVILAVSHGLGHIISSF
jgi:hypothetical protein